MNAATLAGVGIAGLLVAVYGILAGMGMPVDNAQAGMVIGTLVGASAAGPAAYQAGKARGDGGA